MNIYITRLKNSLHKHTSLKKGILFIKKQNLVLSASLDFILKCVIKLKVVIGVFLSFIQMGDENIFDIFAIFRLSQFFIKMLHRLFQVFFHVESQVMFHLPFQSLILRIKVNQHRRLKLNFSSFLALRANFEKYSSCHFLITKVST